MYSETVDWNTPNDIASQLVIHIPRCQDWREMGNLLDLVGGRYVKNSRYGKALAMERRSTCGAIWLMVLSVIIASATSFTAAQEPVRGPVLNLKPIEMTPEPVGQLHPKWQWLAEQRRRSA